MNIGLLFCLLFFTKITFANEAYLDFKIGEAEKRRIFLLTSAPIREKNDNPKTYKLKIAEQLQKSLFYKEIVEFKENLKKSNINQSNFISQVNTLGDILKNPTLQQGNIVECSANILRSNEGKKYKSLESLILVCTCFPDLSVNNHVLIDKTFGQELLILKGCKVSTFLEQLKVPTCELAKKLEVLAQKKVDEILQGLDSYLVSQQHYCSVSSHFKLIENQCFSTCSKVSTWDNGKCKHHCDDGSRNMDNHRKLVALPMGFEHSLGTTSYFENKAISSLISEEFLSLDIPPGTFSEENNDKLTQIKEKAIEAHEKLKFKRDKIIPWCFRCPTETSVMKNNICYDKNGCDLLTEKFDRQFGCYKNCKVGEIYDDNKKCIESHCMSCLKKYKALTNNIELFEDKLKICSIIKENKSKYDLAKDEIYQLRSLVNLSFGTATYNLLNSYNPPNFTKLATKFCKVNEKKVEKLEDFKNCDELSSSLLDSLPVLIADLCPVTCDKKSEIRYISNPTFVPTYACYPQTCSPCVDNVEKFENTKPSIEYLGNKKLWGKELKKCGSESIRLATKTLYDQKQYLAGVYLSYCKDRPTEAGVICSSFDDQIHYDDLYRTLKYSPEYECIE